MKRSLIIAVVLSVFIPQILFAGQLAVIPVPTKCVQKKGEFTVNERTGIVLFDDSKEMQNAVRVFKELFSAVAGYSLPVSIAEIKKNVIECHINPNLKDDESYRMKIRPSKIVLEAKTVTGIFYGFQTLRQLLPAEIESKSKLGQEVKWSIPCADIEDTPKFSYRGLMLDVSRHFKSVQDIKRSIDLMAFHKLNVLHWHLTDDQGWRIEIKKYPKLTEAGGFRDKTIIGHASNRPYQWEVSRYGGFYTQEEIKEVVAYAQERFVTIIPEIEMPGHCVAALTAYPEYSCTGGPFEVEGRWGVFNDVYCAKEETFKFLEDVLDEVVRLFPSKYVHIGGDEVPKMRWERCAACQKRMIEKNLPDEEHLQSYFINRMESYLNSKGKAIIGWDEILEGQLSKSATVMSWRGIKGGVRAAKEGRDVILSPNSHFYFNHYQLDPKTEPLSNTGYTPLEKAYNFNPLPEELSTNEQKHIIGVQANLWTEYMDSQEKTDYFLYPRVAALAEVGWGQPRNKDFMGFYQRLLHIEKHYDIMGVNYCKGHKPGGALRIMSYNVRNGIGIDGKMSYDRVAQVIKEYAPDVVAVQELDSVTERSNRLNVLDELAMRTNRHWIYASSIDFMGGKYGIGLLSKEEPLSYHSFRLPNMEGKEARVALLVEFDKYVMCCTHLSLSETERIESISVIEENINKMKIEKPVFLAGDMNSEVGDNTQKAIMHSFAYLSDITQPTIPADRPIKCIDYIYQYKKVDKKVTVLKSKVIDGVYGSDHLPIYVDLLMNM